MNYKNLYYDGFYKEYTFDNESVNIVLLELLKYNIKFPIHYDIDDFNVYDKNSLSEQWLDFMKNFNMDKDSFMLRDKGCQTFTMGRNGKGYDFLNFELSSLNDFSDKKGIINDYLKISFLINSKYNFFQSIENPRMYNLYKLKYDKSKLYFNENIQMELLDISSNVGRERRLEKFSFYPAYKIWFGEEAQTLFGREKILDFSEAVYIKELSCGVIEMQLMDDITKPHLPYNQVKQQKITEYFGIDRLEIKKY